MNRPLSRRAPTDWSSAAQVRQRARRNRGERIFAWAGALAVIAAMACLILLLGSMLYKGIGGISLHFLTGSDATDPAEAGIWGAAKGSLLTMSVTLGLSFPIGVLTALYLEEYAPTNRWTDVIEVSINNLAAVPSIIFGLLGLAVFLNFMHLPRSAPLVGGITLALMTFPVIVIAGRNAIKAVPPSIRDAALAIGASPVQVVFHHVLPLALPGILTGTIIGMARALGETAPC
jgi:phosphate transport system permease protein